MKVKKLCMVMVLMLAACSPDVPDVTYKIQLVDKVIVVEGRCDPKSAGDFFMLVCPNKVTTIRRSEIKQIEVINRVR